MDKIGSTEKFSVKLWKDSRFTLLFAIRKSNINVTQTEEKRIKCPATTQNPLGERVEYVKSKTNFDKIINEIESQTGLKSALDVVMKDELAIRLKEKAKVGETESVIDNEEPTEEELTEIELSLPNS